MYHGPLLNRKREKPYVTLPGLNEDVRKYLSSRVYKGFVRHFVARRFVGSTVQSALGEICPNPSAVPAVWIDFGLDEAIDTDDEEFERGLKEIGKKYGIDLSIHPSNLRR